MTLPRRAHSPEEHLALLIDGLKKLQEKIEAGERVKWEVQLPEAAQPMIRKTQSDQGQGLLQIEGGYTPGRYALADKLAHAIAEKI